MDRREKKKGRGGGFRQKKTGDGRSLLRVWSKTLTGRRTLWKRSTGGRNSRTTTGITTRARRRRRGNTRRRTAGRRLPCALKRARSLTFSGGIISSTEG